MLLFYASKNMILAKYQNTAFKLKFIQKLKSANTRIEKNFA